MRPTSSASRSCRGPPRARARRRVGRGGSSHGHRAPRSSSGHGSASRALSAAAKRAALACGSACRLLRTWAGCQYVWRARAPATQASRPRTTTTPTSRRGWRSAATRGGTCARRAATAARGRCRSATRCSGGATPSRTSSTRRCTWRRCSRRRATRRCRRRTSGASRRWALSPSLPPSVSPALFLVPLSFSLSSLLLSLLSPSLSPLSFSVSLSCLASVSSQPISSRPGGGGGGGAAALRARGTSSSASKLMFRTWPHARSRLTRRAYLAAGGAVRGAAARGDGPAGRRGDHPPLVALPGAVATGGATHVAPARTLGASPPPSR